MLNLLQAIRSKISGSALSASVGDRIFPDEYPASMGAPVFPYCIYFIVSDVPDNVFVKNGESVLLQFSLFSSSESLIEISAILSSLRTLFDDCSLSITGSNLVWFKREGFQPMVEGGTTTEGATRIKHWAQDYEISTQAT